jgi:hypothetical protein
MPASATTCNPLPALEIEFDASGPAANPHLSFAPVACAEGEFSIDKLPMAFTSVRLGDHQVGWKSATIDAATGDAALDLTF